MIKFNQILDLFKRRNSSSKTSAPVVNVAPVVTVVKPRIAVASNGKRYHSVRDQKTGRFTKVS